MTAEEKQQIRQWLCGPRNYDKGVALYERFGHNRMLRRRFVMDRSKFSAGLLAEELRKLAGISALEFQRLPRLAMQTEVVTEEAVEETTANDKTGGEPQKTDATDTVRKVKRFREKYTCLNDPDCPDVLKVLVSDMFSAYDAYKEAHARMQQLPDDAIAEAETEAQTIVENYLKNREIREELDYYQEHRVLLGRADKVAAMKRQGEFAAISDIDLRSELMNARSNVTKSRKRVAKAEAAGDAEKIKEATETAERWIARKVALESELNQRKKK